MPPVQGQDVDDLAPRDPERETDPGELGGQERQVERCDPEAGQVRPVEGGEQFGGDRGERRRASATSASVKRWTAVAAAGIGTPGLTRRWYNSCPPPGKSVKAATSTILSALPDWSRSIRCRGRPAGGRGSSWRA